MQPPSETMAAQASKSQRRRQRAVKVKRRLFQRTQWQNLIDEDPPKFENPFSKYFTKDTEAKKKVYDPMLDFVYDNDSECSDSLSEDSEGTDLLSEDSDMQRQMEDRQAFQEAHERLVKERRKEVNGTGTGEKTSFKDQRKPTEDSILNDWGRNQGTGQSEKSVMVVAGAAPARRDRILQALRAFAMARAILRCRPRAEQQVQKYEGTADFAQDLGLAERDEAEARSLRAQGRIRDAGATAVEAQDKFARICSRLGSDEIELEFMGAIKQRMEIISDWMTTLVDSTYTYEGLTHTSRNQFAKEARVTGVVGTRSTLSSS